MGWGEKAIEIRSVDKGLLDGVFMHKRANKLKFLCERNDKGKLFLVRIKNSNVIVQSFSRQFNLHQMPKSTSCRFHKDLQ